MDIIDDAPERFEKARQWIIKGLSTPSDFPPQLEIISDLIEQGETKFKTLREFINAPINHDGLGIKDNDRLKLLLWYNPHHDHVSKRLSVKLGLAEQAKHIEPLARNGQKGGGKASLDRNENVKASNVRDGNSNDYRIARLKRDFPEIAKGIGTKYKSVNEACRAAGLLPQLREKKQVWFYKDDPKAAIKALSEYYGIEVNYEG